MHKASGIHDISVWTGEWPFLKLRFRTPEELEKKLTGLGIEKAYIAPLEGLFEQNTIRSNRELFEKVRSPFFSPVPIIDLSYGNWRTSMDMALADGRVELVKLLPSYHRYELTPEILRDLVKLTTANGMVIGIQIRFEDRRGAYPPLSVPELDINRLIWAVSAFREQPFIFHNMFIREINTALDPGENVYVDISSMEFHNTLKEIRTRGGLERVLFSSHSPFYYPEGGIAKLGYADMEKSTMEQVAFGNAKTLFGK